jgi:hypothetical protein
VRAALKIARLRSLGYFLSWIKDKKITKAKNGYQKVPAAGS